MAIAPTVGVPSVVEAGNYVSFTEEFPEYPVATWGSIFVISTATVPFVTTATISGASFLYTLATTPELPVGNADWAIYATKDGRRVTVKNGTLTVLPNLATPATASAAQAMLTALEATITSLAGSKNQSVTFNGQSFTKREMGSLLTQRVQLQAEVIRERAALARARGGLDPGRIAIEFAPPNGGNVSFPFCAR
jgi:hypothetical protein